MSAPRVRVSSTYVRTLDDLELLVAVAREQGLTADAAVELAVSPQTVSVWQSAEDIAEAAATAAAEAKR